MLNLSSKSLLLTFFVVFIVVVCGQSANGDYDLTIRIPHVAPEKEDALWCTAVKLDPEEAYIVNFTPHASKETAHHLVTYGCSTLANHNKAWSCEDSDLARTEHSMCGDGEEREILFAWALDAPERSLPPNVGLRISGSTNIKYLVIQLHYAKKFPDGMTDNSGMTYHITHQRPIQQMGYYVLGSRGVVPPQQEVVHLEAACRYDGEYPIYPIGYRTHSHRLGVVTSGYRIRDGKWTEIGRMSPQLPQTFYNISTPGIDIQKGDILASRCTMNSMSTHGPTWMGPKHSDEMCNFYIMYSTHNPNNLRDEMCFPEDLSYAWEYDIPEYLPPPPKVSSLDGIHNADYVRDKFNMTSS